MRGRLCAVVVLVSACGTPSNVEDCGGAATAIVKTLAHDKAESLDGIRDVVAKRCREDFWPLDARHCMVGATTLDAVHACARDRLTAEQSGRLDDVVAVAVTPRDAVAKLQAFADQMCSCKDHRCVESVQREMVAWGGAATRDLANPGVAKRSGAVLARYTQCMVKLTMPPDPLPDDGSGGGAARISIASKDTFLDTTLTVDTVLAKIQAAYMGGVRRCYKDLLKQDPDAHGKVALSLTVDATGRVKDGVASGFATELDSCVTALMPAWRFPVPEDADGEPTTASFVIGLQLVAN